MPGSGTMERQFRAPTVAILGVGLIGGSLGLALGGAGFATRRLGWDRDPAALEEALRAGAIDAASTLEGAVDTADILVLATPVRAAMDLLEVILSRPRSDTAEPVITDVGSVKGALLERARQLCGEPPPRLIPAHPIAGGESSGVAAARADLFRDHRVILTPADNADATAVERVAAMWRSAGAVVEQLDAAEHDRILSLTSHLPHFLAYALVDTLGADGAREQIFRFAAGGFRDFTRIASSDPVMWRDIALSNRGALLEAIDAFSARLDHLRAAVDEGSGDILESVFRNAKATRDRHVGLPPRGGEQN